MVFISLLLVAELCITLSFFSCKTFLLNFLSISLSVSHTLSQLHKSPLSPSNQSRYHEFYLLEDPCPRIFSINPPVYGVFIITILMVPSIHQSRDVLFCSGQGKTH